MINAIEDNFMVNSIKDLANLKSLDSDNRTKAKQMDKAHSNADLHLDLDSVNLSTTSKALEALKDSLRNIPEVNDARVMHFKNEIESGKYQIQSDKIAKNMLNHLEMA